jgi:hypothetical protein
MRNRARRSGKRWKPEPMCPLCLSTLAWLALGCGSASTLALLIGIKRKGIDHGDDCHCPSNRDA